MKKIKDNVVMEMTPEEVAQWEKEQAEIPPRQPTEQEQIDELKAENAELRQAIQALVSGDTGEGDTVL